MMRVPILTSAIVFVASASLAAPSPELPLRAPQAVRPSLTRDWSAEEPLLPLEEEVPAEAIVIAGRKGGRGGGGGGGGRNRGGASGKNRGGFNKGNARHAGRVGEPGRVGRPGDPGGIRGGVRDVDVNRNVNVRGGNVNVGGGGGGGYYGEGDWDDDDDNNELGAALVGGVVGLGVGSLLNRDVAE
jgi:hypothetical protein